MTTNPPDRLDRIEAILGGLAAQQQQTQQQIDAMLALYDGLEQRLEQEAAQAAIDREEFRTTVRDLLQVLTQRFTSNGH